MAESAELVGIREHLTYDSHVRTVLIVEDDGDLRRMFRTALAFAGYRILEARDGLTALQVFDTDRPDVIVLDLDLPIISGQIFRTELAASIQLRDIPIVVVTGNPIAEMTPPVACLLRKPLSPEQLVFTVHRCIGPP